MTNLHQKRWNLVSRLYSRLDQGMQTGQFEIWRKQLMTYIKGTHILEVGVGTGANLSFYPQGLSLTGIDFSMGMLQKAALTAKEQRLEIDLQQMDIQDLKFPDASFDTVISTCVFCSVADPSLGLDEIHRVLRPNGRLIMLEHVRSDRWSIGLIMDVLNPILAWGLGEHINRKTGKLLQVAGFSVTEEHLWYDIVRLFTAKKLPLFSRKKQDPLL